MMTPIEVLRHGPVDRVAQHGKANPTAAAVISRQERKKVTGNHAKSGIFLNGPYLRSALDVRTHILGSKHLLEDGAQSRPASFRKVVEKKRLFSGKTHCGRCGSL